MHHAMTSGLRTITRPTNNHEPGCSMTVMIGIHQQQEKVDKLYENLGARAASLAAIGPFPTKDDALDWQQTMRQKIGDCQVIDMGNPEDTATPWYGFFFEQ